MKRIPIFLIMGMLLSLATELRGEDCSNLWLRFDGGCNANVTGVKCTAMEELKQNWQGNPVVLKRQKKVAKDGYVITTKNGKTTIAYLVRSEKVESMHIAGYRIQES